MPHSCRLAVISDIHYAGAEEKARCEAFDFRRQIPNYIRRQMARAAQHHVWLRQPWAHNYHLDQFLAAAGEPDWVVANGDFSCDTAQIGVQDPAAFASAAEGLDKLRRRFGLKLQCVLGDHELGKPGLFNPGGYMHLGSWEQATGALGIQPFWQRRCGAYRLAGVTSSLISLPVLTDDYRPEDGPAWQTLRTVHMNALRELFESLERGEKVILFCHDPTALPLLWEEPVVRGKIDQVELTIVGHLHSPAIFRLSRCLTGMPPIRFIGQGTRKMTAALNRARHWKSFRVHLCPSPAGIQLFKDGGWLEVQLDPAGVRPAQVRPHALPWL
ncbi:MAG TPA: metallophosphoesterase [Verrucomicrobiae bacterium]